MSQLQTAPCAVPGCPGQVAPTTNGAGRVIPGACPCCAKRGAWERAELAKLAPVPCRLCGGLLPRRETTNGARRSYCDACSTVRDHVKDALRGDAKRQRRAHVRAA